MVVYEHPTRDHQGHLMAPDDEQQTMAEQPAPEAVHHKSISEMEPLRDLPVDEEEEVEEQEEVFEPGPIFGEGM